MPDAKLLSNTILHLCQSPATVTSEHDKDPSIAPGDIVKRLYGKRNLSKSASTPVDHQPASAEELERVRECGKWGQSAPGDLFLQAFRDSLACIDDDPLACVVSPPLIGSSGTIPLTIIAPLAECVRHVSNLIVRAKKEVFLATCAWSPSVAQSLISDALKELSRRAAERGDRVVVRIMFDKANASQILAPHQSVKPEIYAGAGIKLPTPQEVPQLDLEVTNFHQPVLGTLHAKFVVVDRTIGFVQSNNMEDNENMEMAVHLEGPIVASLYDTALITWNNHFSTRVRAQNSSGVDKHGKQHENTMNPLKENENPRPTERLAEEKDNTFAQVEHDELPEHEPCDSHYDSDLPSEIKRVQSAYSPRQGESLLQAINRRLNVAAKTKLLPTAEEPESEFMPYISHRVDKPFPIALVSRPPYGAPNKSNVFVPQNEAWLSTIRNAKTSVFIQSPNINAIPVEVLTAAVKRGVEVTHYVTLGYNDAGEMMPGQGGTNEMWASKLKGMLTAEDRARLHIHWHVGKDQTTPVHHNARARSSHIKLLIVDGRVGIQGSGNQDTQSWYHSQEINIMIDSEQICREWREGIERNQNTAKYGGGGDEDGIWRDKDSNEAEGAVGNVAPPMSWIKGVTGMVKKAQEKGGFG